MDATQADISAEAAQAIAQEAYVWGFPIVMNYKTMFNYVIDTDNPEYKGPFNQLSCAARLFTPNDKAVVTPNADTPYCMFWMDLRAEPMVLTVPEMEPERFYHFQLIDLYTHNFAYVGTLTTGNGAGKFLLAGPCWDGEKPEGITDVIRSETDFIFDVTRTQLFGSDDLDNVEQIQASYDVQPLSQFLGADAPPAKPLPDFPKWVEGSQFDARLFAYLDQMMTLLGKPAEGDEKLWEDLARLGIGTNEAFDFDALDADVQTALEAGTRDGFAEIEAFIKQYSSDPLFSGKIFGTREFLTESAKQNYKLDRIDLPRSAAAHTGLYGNSAAEAIYPAYFTDTDKEPLDASKNSYTMTFEAESLPPVKAFWSVTMYDGETQLFIENSLDRYLLNSTMMEQFKRQDDGSLVLHISQESPGPELESNWLPAPDGPFYVIMRLYGPDQEALDGSWTPPVVQPKPVEETQFPAFQPSDADIYENNFLEVMQFVVNHTTFDPDDEMDAAVLAALKPLGVEPGKTFDPQSAKAIDGKALGEVARKVHQEALEMWVSPEGEAMLNDLFLPKGEMNPEAMVLQSAYGPIGLPAHQAVYPGIATAAGQPLNAQYDYVIRMSRDEMPPARAFWSVTLYDATGGFFIPNDKKKYSVGENAGFQLDDQGGIEIHIAAEKPEGVPEENWLPINRGDEALDLVMRIYAPDLEKMKTWTAPKAEKVDK
jgi:hypothetical protein